jgi:hypothetical protein
MLDPLKANMVLEEDEMVDGDVFVKKDEDGDVDAEDTTPDSFEELPIEIRSLTERYRKSNCTGMLPCLTQFPDSSNRSQPKCTRRR